MASFITTALSGGASTGARTSIHFRMIQTHYITYGYLRSGDGLLFLREKQQPCSIRVGSSSSRGKEVITMIKGMMGGGGGGGGGVAKFKGTQKREKQLTEMIEKKVMEAKQVCEGDERSDECKVAWDEVEEVSQAKADLRLKLLEKQDPLEFFCQDNPETDECRIYDD